MFNSLGFLLASQNILFSLGLHVEVNTSHSYHNINNMEIDSEKNEETMPSPPSIVQGETVTNPIDPVALVDVNRDIAVGHKRPAWARQTFKETEGHAVPRGTF
jgi:hypothetical protein